MKQFTSLLALALLATSCISQTTGEAPDPIVAFERVEVVAGDLVSFQTCDDLLAYYVDHAIEVVGPYGLPGSNFGGPIALDGAFADDAAESAGASAPAAGRDFTDTNVQVQGVDEADIVKTDGFRIFTTLDNILRTWEVGSPGVAAVGKFELPIYPQAMYLYNNTIIVAGANWNAGPAVDFAREYNPGYGTSVTTVIEIDVSDLAQPKIVRSVDFDGTYAQSRLVDGVLRLAVNSMPVGLEWSFPSGSGLRAERDATEANKAIIQNSTLENWLPFSVVHEGSTEREGDLLDCARVAAPDEFSGIDTLFLLTFDLDAGIGSWDSAGVVASGITMYANATHTYLATQRWFDWWSVDETGIREASEGFKTQIHLFETIGKNPPGYLASGEVTGFLLNQFAMDEYGGDLRVASTTSPNGWWFSDESQSLVTVLSQDGAKLQEVGRVDGLGLTEQIFAVRFLGETGYVVTFRQTDPLYVIDLSDASNPTVAGELKIPGYSAYLHPLGDGKLLGLGQDADDNGRVLGTQLSLFDVSNPSDPIRIDTVTLEGGWSQAEGDHHAFTYVDGLILAPYQRWEWSETDGGRSTFDTGVIAARLDGSDLELDSILRPVADGPVEDKEFEQGNPWEWTPVRTIVIDGYVYTISYGGIAIFEVDTLERLDWVPNT